MCILLTMYFLNRYESNTLAKTKYIRSRNTSALSIRIAPAGNMQRLIGLVTQAMN